MKVQKIDIDIDIGSVLVIPEALRYWGDGGTGWLPKLCKVSF